MRRKPGLDAFTIPEGRKRQAASTCRYLIAPYGPNKQERAAAAQPWEVPRIPFRRCQTIGSSRVCKWGKSTHTAEPTRGIASGGNSVPDGQGLTSSGTKPVGRR